MHHRHLLPNEIDLLLDEDSGFGVKPLREHVEACADCAARLAAARQVVASLAEVPLFAPRMGLADRVMAQVPVFVPWHVSARDSLRRWVPASPVARALAAVLVAVAGTLITGVTLWVASRGDLLGLMTALAGEQARATATDAAGNVFVSLFGQQLVQAVQQVGPMGLALAGGGFLIASAATILGLRFVATSSRARS